MQKWEKAVKKRILYYEIYPINMVLPEFWLSDLSNVFFFILIFVLS
jgi:hypothetical protein